MKKRILVWETLGMVSGGQQMTLKVIDLLSDRYDFHCLIPTEGPLSEELKKRNIPYTLLGDQSMPTGVKAKSVSLRYLVLSFKAVAKGLSAVRREKIDIIYTPGPAALPWSAFVGAIKRKPVIWHLHHVFLDGATKRLLNFCGRWKSVRRIVAVSKCVGDQMQNIKAREKTTVLYNPIDFERFSSGDGQVVIEELELNLKKQLVIGHIGILQALKKQDFVMQVGRELKNRGHDVKLLFAGCAREEDQGYVEELHLLAEQLEMNESVLFLGQRSDVPNLLQVMNLIMIPSSFEGFPLVGLEAAAAGVPLVACDVAGAEEIIRISGGGASYREGDVMDAADKVEQIIQAPDVYIERGRSFAQLCTNERYWKKLVLCLKM